MNVVLIFQVKIVGTQVIYNDQKYIVLNTSIILLLIVHELLGDN